MGTFLPSHVKFPYQRSQMFPQLTQLSAMFSAADFRAAATHNCCLSPRTGQEYLRSLRDLPLGEVAISRTPTRHVRPDCATSSGIKPRTPSTYLQENCRVDGTFLQVRATRDSGRPSHTFQLLPQLGNAVSPAVVLQEVGV